MSFFISAVVLILLVVLFVFLGVGLLFILGIVLVVAVVAAVASFVFGGIFGDDSPFSFIHSLNKGRELPDKFNTCLIEEQPEVCLKDWTTWDADKLEVIKVLAQQVKNELGRRGNSHSNSYTSNSMNGKGRIEMDLVTDFEKKEGVHEHYVLVDDKDGIRIEELKWDYK